MKKKKIVIALNSAWNLYNFRAGLIKSLVTDGYDVIAVAPSDEYAALLPSLGCRFVSIDMDTTGTNPVKDILLFARYLRILLTERPNAFLGFTIKPNVYGSIAAYLTRTPTINNVAGLGYTFKNNNWLANFAIFLYRMALRNATMVLFQNTEDMDVFIRKRVVSPLRSRRIPGSGVDIARFTSCPPIKLTKERPFRFLFAARLLWDKGVAEYIEASRRLRNRHPNVEFCIAGFTINDPKKGVSISQLKTWEKEGIIRYLGVSDNIEEEFTNADCVVLPSYYREGVPRVLLEAAAARRPLITTDWIGCREVVDDGCNGFLCIPKNTDSLTQSMQKMLELSEDQLIDMGEKGRSKVTRTFGENIIIDIYKKLLDDLHQTQRV